MKVSRKGVAPLLLGGLVIACEDPVTPPVPDVAIVTINEFLASNDFGFMDKDGDAEDWIELHNSGSASADLTGWYLTDDGADLTRWAVPEVTLAPGAFLVVFASGKDRRDPTSELHTNFKLSAGGERLALVQPDGLTVEHEFAPEYPPQTTDISYGTLPTGPTGFLRQPTPGAPNSIQAVGAVTMTPTSGLFVDSVTLTMSEASSATIHYTTDGSIPSAFSPMFSGSLTLTHSAKIRVRAIEGTFTGPESGGFYTAIDSTLVAYQADLPLVVVHTLGDSVPNNGNGVESAMTIFASSSGKTTINSTVEYAGGTSVDIRGRTSTVFPKKQYKLELHDASGSDLDRDLLGMGLEEDWILYAPGYYDRSMIANPLMQQLAGQLGLPKMKSRFVELFLAQDDGPVSVDDYVGLYTLGENVKIGPNRIDLTNLKLGDDALPEVTGGFLLKLGVADPDEFAFGMTNGFPYSGTRIVVTRPKLDDLSEAQKAWVQQYFTDFHAAVKGPQSADSLLGYAPFIDVDSWIDAHILRLVAKDPDFLIFSHYMAKDREGKIKTIPLWDFDRALNSSDDRATVPDEVSAAAQVFHYEWWGHLFQDPAYVLRYQNRWTDLRGSVLADASVAVEIDALAAMIASTYPREDAVWGQAGGYGSRYGDFAGEITALKAWLTTRLAFLDGVVAGL